MVDYRIFNITIIDVPLFIIDNLRYVTGEITIGDFKQQFDMCVENWSLEEYFQQWHEGINRIQHSPYSCLIVNVQDLFHDPWIQMWVLCKSNKYIYFSCRFLMHATVQLDKYSLSLFNPSNCYDFILPRNTNICNQAVDLDNYPIEEWSISEKDFFNSIKKGFSWKKR